MTEDDINETIQSFGKAAKRAVEAGADGIQLHGAHGYLINQFLSPFYNTRSDGWGGSEQGRFRFLERVLTEIKTAIPKNTPILIKLNTNDHTPREGVTPGLAARYAQRLAEMGIDAVEISSGSMSYSFMNVCRGRVPVQELLDTMPFWKKPIAKIMVSRLIGKYDLEEGYHLEAAKTIKPVLGDIPLILVGGMRRVTHMEEILENGYADFVSMSRPFIREPFLVKRIETGKADCASCVSCNRCLGAIANGMPLRCYNRPD
jgi:2,4-dienoyl-CoA reductase-like NADH-dependent reductase (Old Yellow Enzyme family)